MGKRDKKISGQIQKKAFNQSKPTTLKQKSRFQPAKRHSIFLIIPSQLDFASNKAPSGGDPGTS
jgi:hypothetical protein